MFLTKKDDFLINEVNFTAIPETPSDDDTENYLTKKEDLIKIIIKLIILKILIIVLILIIMELSNL